jgi:outer membrane immunogenic protein
MKIIIAGIALIGTAVGAQAADLTVRAPYTKAPPIAAVYDWTGFYLGVNAGIGLGRDRTQHYDGAGEDSLYLSPLGAVGGGQIGYNWQTNSFLGPLVLGVEADIQGADMRDGFVSVDNSAYSQRLDWFGTVRGRIGLVTGPTLSYLTAGYAYGNVNTSGVTGGAPFALSGTRSGWTWGSGVEAALGGNWTGKIEYLYLNLGDRTHVYDAGAQTVRTELREQIFRVGLNYRIGGNSTYMPMVAANWNGFYLGGNFGSGTARNRTTAIDSIDPGATSTLNLAPDGLNGGVQAGYNWQTGNVVFGLEADIQGASLEDNKTCFQCAAGLAINSKLPWFGTVRGRLGYSVGPSLFYATGGLAYGGVKTSLELTGIGSESFSQTRTGWTVGAGIETPFTLFGLFGPNWTSKTEYLYVDLGTATNAVTLAGAAGTLSTRVEQHIFRTGLNYHFNAPVVANY